MNASWPTNGSVMILNASAENGASSDAGPLDLLLGACPGTRPTTDGMSIGDGR